MVLLTGRTSSIRPSNTACCQFLDFLSGDGVYRVWSNAYPRVPVLRFRVQRIQLHGYRSEWLRHFQRRRGRETGWCVQSPSGDWKYAFLFDSRFLICSWVHHGCMISTFWFQRSIHTVGIASPLVHAGLVSTYVPS